MRRDRRSPAMDNIDTIVRLEEQFLQQRTLVQRIGDAIGGFAGSMKFVVLHIALFAFWYLANSKRLPGIPAFDPYPYLFLNMALSMEAVVLSTFVLMKQNRESKRAEQREQLMLQIDLLAEQEITKTLQLVRRLCDHLGIEGIDKDKEAKILSESTAVEGLVETLRQKLPGE
jgi:uncharacterized membrane protein